LFVRVAASAAPSALSLHDALPIFDIGDADAFGYELVQGQPALFIEVDEHREIALGQAVAVPGGLEPAAATEHIGQRNGELHLRGGHAHQHDGAGEVTTVEGLPPGLRAADGV